MAKVWKTGKSNKKCSRPRSWHGIILETRVRPWSWSDSKAKSWIDTTHVKPVHELLHCRIDADDQHCTHQGSHDLPPGWKIVSEGIWDDCRSQGDENRLSRPDGHLAEPLWYNRKHKLAYQVSFLLHLCTDILYSLAPVWHLFYISGPSLLPW